jgi:hypothetical protein
MSYGKRFDTFDYLLQDTVCNLVLFPSLCGIPEIPVDHGDVIAARQPADEIRMILFWQKGELGIVNVW